MTVSTVSTVKDLLEKNKNAILASMPKGVNIDRFYRVAINAISTTPKLAQCSAQSLFLSIVKGFALGLEVNGLLGEAYLVPFWNSKKRCHEAQFMPGYRGLIRLCRQSGEVSLIYADSIRGNDTYLISRGTDPKLEHKIFIGNRGDIIAYYTVVKMKDDTFDFEIMTPPEIEEIRAKSKSKDDGPWITDYDEMAKKTVLKRLMKRAPMSVENYALAKAVTDDNKAASGESQEFIDIKGIDITNEYDETTQLPEGEIRERQKREKRETILKPTERLEPPKTAAEINKELDSQPAVPVPRKEDIPLSEIIEDEIEDSGAPMTTGDCEAYLKRTGKIGMTYSMNQLIQVKKSLDEEIRKDPKQFLCKVADWKAELKEKN